jgi:hypothetical protein
MADGDTTGQLFQILLVVDISDETRSSVPMEPFSV